MILEIVANIKYQIEKMLILGISAYMHDSAVAIVENGQIIAASSEERFSRIKHDSAFPFQAIAWILNYRNCKLSDFDAIVFYDKPLLRINRLIETYLAFAPKGFLSFVKAMCESTGNLFIKRKLMNEICKIEKINRSNIQIIFSEHHLSHSASAFYPTNYLESAILTMDGVGEWATASISKGNGNNITVLKELHFPHSVGLLYSAFTSFCGFKVNSDEYKLMGLAPYGNRDHATYIEAIKAIKNNIV
jgi:carbamoyltransferase